ncbi:fibronectin type III domain-containing protein [Flavobacterium humi]|uniref:T9SS type B sorting domain-containing protein n=1 Tax=Flavobacterium humi TaxID=2562683 RepID=A0A4Z0L8Y6_9FLAO|nr:fibronectin type III domain-containing protein [Flavobacterium humi]TGD58728.1 T9SS type B sorting domain-containing protein [Flavobacterium humi]
MKKITFGFFMMLLPFLSFAQVIDEGFEGATFPPTAAVPGNWAVFDNGVGTGSNWTETTNAALVHSGAKAAFVDREGIGSGNTSQDWLVTPRITVPANGQLRFFTRQTLIGNNGSTYEIRISTDPVQSNLAGFNATPLQSWTETTLNATYNVYEEKLVSLSGYAGQQVYIAFVKVHTQTGGSTTGDRWLVDDVKVLQQCLDPTALGVGTITPTSAVLLWTANGGATTFDVEVIPAAASPLGNPSPGGAGIANNQPFGGLTPGTAYKYYVRAVCGGGNNSQWVGPYTFLTTPAGSICSSPIVIGGLPFSQSSNTNLYGDEVDTPQGAGCAGGATNYMAGAEVFYSYTPTFTGNITISMTPTGVSSSLYVYNGCANVGVSCLGGVADNTGNPRVIQPLAVTAGQTYIIVISSSTTPAAGIPYSLVIQQFNCTPPVGLPTTNINTTSADLSWTNPTGATAWEVAVQPAGSGIPTGAGQPAATNTNFTVGPLTPATAYQYWVRADCGGGVFSSWAGPYTFSTAICDAVDRCDFVFRMTDSFGDGWNGARMEVRQNGVVVATIGSTFTAGAGPINITVPLCQNFPFELHWTVPGSFPGEVGVSVINNFGQTLYNKPSGTGSAPSLLYTSTFSCSTPACLPPTALTATGMTTTTANLAWNGAGATMWDVYVVTNGSAAPDASTVPTYNDITTNAQVAGPLLPLTTYQFYVRVVCSGTSNSIWAGPVTFTTLPTCPQPTALTVSNISMNSATLAWTEAQTATAWDIYVVDAGSAAPTATSTPTFPSVTNNFSATGLLAGHCYEYYVRAVCSPTDSSLWSGPKSFCTTICLPANQCNYTFRLTDSFGDGWNGARMEVRQNGIVVATLGATFTTGAGPINILVPLCDDIPFELHWTVPGSFPGEVGVSIIDPFTDVLYTKAPGVGSAPSLLYSDMAQCTPPTCAKPITLGANTITQTTANLTWVQPAAPGSPVGGWQIVVQPAILGAPTGAGTPAAATTFAAGSLTPGTLYEFYVRTDCGAADGLSGWAGPFAFGTQVSNNECAQAIVVPVNDDASCALFGSGSVIGATGSLPATACGGTANDDVWFQFTATSTKHYINLFNVAGSTTDLNHVVYSGTCGALVQQGACQLNNNSIISGLTIGNVYYVRVYTATATTNQTTTFNICIGTVSTCSTAEATCSNPTDPFIFPNTTGVPSEGQQACLFTNPNPTYYFMTILQSGNLSFQITQNTAFDAAGNPTGTGLDVDFVAWGPFTSNSAACGNLGNGCPTPGACPNNTTNPTFYPYVPGNIMDCSYSAAPVETFTINNAVAGQVYVIVITNFNGAPGFIRFDQTNFGVPGSGLTDCSIVCEVDLGPDQNLCGVSSVVLDSHLNNPLATFVWKKGTDVIVGATSSTYTATESGTYTVIGTCAPNDVQDSMVLNLGPNVIIGDQPDYALCDDASNDGIATFDLSTLTTGILAGLDPNFTYNITYHYNEADALTGLNAINPAIPYTGASQTIFIRVVAVGYPVCNTIVPQNLVVKPTPIATLTSSDADNTICSNETATISVNPVNFVATDATYTWTLNSNPIAATGSQITPTASGTYGVTINLNGCTAPLTLTFTINALPDFGITGTNLVKCANETAVLTVAPNVPFAAGVTYSWTHDGNPMPGETAATLSTTAYGIFAVTVNNLGCTTTHQIEITLDSTNIPINTVGECQGSNYMITATPQGTGTYTYDWYNGNDLTTPIVDGDAIGSSFNVTAYANANNISSFPVTFVVKVTTTPEGCTDSETFVVESPLCTIQKGISPNNDGDNDEFDLRGLGVRQLSIFNRYGTKVYSLANYTNEWKGQSDKGNILPDGTYYYVIEQTSGETKSGWIYINR